MKLDPTEFKVFKKLEELEKEGKLDEKGKTLLEKLRAKKASNALAWWAKYPELLKDVVNIAFNYMGGKVQLGLGDAQNGYFQPGVVRIPYVQTIGRSVDKSSPINLQMYQLWLQMHRKYRGIGAYQMADLAIAIIAIIDAFGECAEAERIYAMANTYKAGNRNIPFTMAKAMNVDLDEVSSNLADFRYAINLVNRKLSALCLPKGLSMLENRVTLNTGVFKDSENERGVVFFWDTEYYMLYEAARYNTGGSITYKHHSTDNSKRTTATIIKDLNAQVDALILDDDIARICSDILAAFGENGIDRSTEMPEDYSLAIVKSDERLHQLHNLTYFGDGSVRSGYLRPFMNYFSTNIWSQISGRPNESQYYMDIVQENNEVHHSLMSNFDLVSGQEVKLDMNGRPIPNSYAGGLPMCGQPTFDSWEVVPSVETVMCGTRFTAYTRAWHVTLPDTTTVTVGEVSAYGSELCLAPEFYNRINGVPTKATCRQWYYTNNGVLQANSLMLADITKLDWHPLIYVYPGSDTPATASPQSIFGDLDNFVFLTLQELSRLHEVALLSGYKLDAASVSDK